MFFLPSSGMVPEHGHFAFLDADADADVVRKVLEKIFSKQSS